jgi:hypothetical protein
MGATSNVPHDATGASVALDRGSDQLPVALDEGLLEAESRTWTPAKIALWVAISLLGGVSWVMLAVVRGETVNAVWFVFAAISTYFIGYRFYSKFICSSPTTGGRLRPSTRRTARTTPRRTIRLLQAPSAKRAEWLHTRRVRAGASLRACSGGR